MTFVKRERAFLTGCDLKTEWQLPWFVKNFTENSSDFLYIADFGMTDDMAKHIMDHPSYGSQLEIFTFASTASGWFKKPRAIWEATFMAYTVCWLDTDCEVVGDISSIFDYYIEGKLGMVKDQPWTTRRPGNGDWHNTGVVVSDRNWNLRDWMIQCEKNPVDGDQEVLHNMLTEIEKLGKIEQLPHKYNVLRLDFVDGTNVDDPIVIHHTGAKGNQFIMEKING